MICFFEEGEIWCWAVGVILFSGVEWIERLDVYGDDLTLRQLEPWSVFTATPE